MGFTDRSNDRRIVVVLAVLLVWGMVIGTKLVRLQVGDHETLRERAERQQQFALEISPTRGVIYDRNGHELARSAEVRSLYASPSQIEDPKAVAFRLAELLDLDGDALLKRLTSSQILVAVKRKLTDGEVSAVEELKLPGLRFVNEMKRFYLSGRTAAHVLGFVDIDERGLGGIELSYDKIIRGSGGRLLINVDALKHPYNHTVEDKVPGANVTLTIDTLIQHDAERALAQAVRSANARGGTVVVIRPATGEVLALANMPTFDPNRVSETTDEQRSNAAVEDAFEPGSIFKIVTYAAALEERVINPSTRIDCGRGEILVAGRMIRDGHPGWLTASRALEKSSNVAAIKIGQQLGQGRLARYIERFGFGRRTGIELPAESRGILRNLTDWTPASLGAIPLGHEVGVTAMQATAAFACIANGGVWVKPYIVSRVNGPGGEVISEHAPEARRVVSRETTEDLKTMLEGVVINGTGKLAQVSGYRVAGKTGTAQKIDEATGRYSKSRHVASFAGFAPVDNPEVACIVSIDEPKGPHTGRDIAAPVFAQVVASALQVLGIPPEKNPKSRIPASEFRVYDIPRTIVAVPRDYGPVDTLVSVDRKVTVPELVGSGLRDALVLCARLGLTVKATGDGMIVQQSPPPGARVPVGSNCYVTLSRQDKRRVTAAAAVAGTEN